VEIRLDDTERERFNGSVAAVRSLIDACRAIDESLA